jgi:hypothetical protein
MLPGRSRRWRRWPGRSWVSNADVENTGADCVVFVWSGMLAAYDGPPGGEAVTCSVPAAWLGYISHDVES